MTPDAALTVLARMSPCASPGTADEATPDPARPGFAQALRDAGDRLERTSDAPSTDAPGTDVPSAGAVGDVAALVAPWVVALRPLLAADAPPASTSTLPAATVAAAAQGVGQAVVAAAVDGKASTAALGEAGARAGSGFAHDVPPAADEAALPTGATARALARAGVPEATDSPSAAPRSSTSVAPQAATGELPAAPLAAGAGAARAAETPTARAPRSAGERSGSAPAPLKASGPDALDRAPLEPVDSLPGAGAPEAVPRGEPDAALKHVTDPAAETPALAAGASSPAREASTRMASVDRMLGTPGWHDDIAQTLAQFVSVRAGDAEIRLNPSHLGPVGIEITYAGNEASVLITAAQPATRDALEQALPQLRELLAQQGIALGESSVRDQRDARPDGAPSDARAAAGQPAPGDAPAAASTTADLRAERVTRLIDTFA